MQIIIILGWMMLSTKALINAAEHYLIELTNLQHAFRQIHNQFIIEQQDNKAKEQLSAIYLRVFKLRQLITELKKTQHDKLVVIASIKCTALIVEVMLITEASLDASKLSETVKKQIDVELLTVQGNVKSLPLNTVGLQTDIYSLYMIKRELMEKENKKEEIFFPIVFLQLFIDHSGDSYTRLLAFRRLYFEYAQYNQTSLNMIMKRYAKDFELCYKKVVSQATDESSLEGISAKFIYYQVNLIYSHLMFAEKNKNVIAKVDVSSESSNQWTVFFDPTFTLDFQPEQILNFIKNEKVYRKKLDQIFQALSNIKYKELAKDYKFAVCVGDLFEELRGLTLRLSNKFSQLLGLTNGNEQYSAKFKDELKCYCEELKKINLKSSELYEGYESEYLKPAIQMKEKNEKEKILEKMLEEDKSNYSDFQNRINKKMDEEISAHEKIAKELLEKINKIWEVILKAEAKKKKFKEIKEAYQNVRPIMQAEDVPEKDSVIVNEHPVIAHLAELDKELFDCSRLLAKRTQAIHGILQQRATSKKVLKGELISDLDEQLKKAYEDLSHLIQLKLEYQKQILQNKDNIKEVEYGVRLSLEFLDELLLQSQSWLNDSMQLLASIIARLATNKTDFIIRLGKREADKEAGNETYTDEQIYKMGWMRFVEIGRQKREKGLPISNLSLEKQYMESLLKIYKDKFFKITPYLVLDSQQGMAGTVIMPDKCRQRFNKLPIACYLVGGVAIKMLKGLPLDSIVDYDFTTFCNNPAYLFEADNRFRSNENIKRLYQLKDNDIKIDLYLADVSKKFANENEWMQADAAQRNFTICSIYIDSKGNIYDPTGRGLLDLNQNILSSISEPTLMLKNDPTCIFSGFKKMVEGFMPDKELENALKQWQPQVGVDKQHIYAIIKKYLLTMLTIDKLKFVDFIIKYNMHEKVFGFRSIESTVNVLDKIKNIVNSGLSNYSQKSSHSPTLFAQNNTEVKSTEPRVLTSATHH